MEDQDIEEALERLKSMQDEMTKKNGRQHKSNARRPEENGRQPSKGRKIARMVARQAENDAWQARMDARRAKLVAFAFMTNRQDHNCLLNKGFFHIIVPSGISDDGESPKTQ
jgi:hypothetical protein